MGDEVEETGLVVRGEGVTGAGIVVEMWTVVVEEAEVISDGEVGEAVVEGLEEVNC